MSPWVAVLLGLVGLGLVAYFAEKLVEGVVGTATGFDWSAFFLSVVFIGFDPGNLAVGVTVLLLRDKVNSAWLVLSGVPSP
jgi:hypothetical protein